MASAKEIMANLVRDQEVSFKCTFCHADNSKFKCSKCKRARYCTETCQRSHWKLHKKTCSPCSVHKKEDLLKGTVDPNSVPMLPKGIHMVQSVGGLPGFPCQRVVTEWVYACTEDGTIWRLHMKNAKWIENVVAATMTNKMPKLFPLECFMADDGMLSFDDSTMVVPWYKCALIS